jgi:hypothetical protein
MLGMNPINFKLVANRLRVNKVFIYGLITKIMHEELIKQIRSIKMRLAIGVITTRNETDHLLMNQLDAMEEIVNKNFALPLVSESVQTVRGDLACKCGNKLFTHRYKNWIECTECNLIKVLQA